MLSLEELAQSICNNENTKEVIDTIISDPDYYHSLLFDNERIYKFKKIRTRTTCIGLAALNNNIAVTKKLLELGAPADGLDMFYYLRSIHEPYNYRKLGPKIFTRIVGTFGFNIEEEEDYWSNYTLVFDREDVIMMQIPWSSPVILAILGENATCLSLLLNHGATCDLRHRFYSKSLEYCEDEMCLRELAKQEGVHMKDTTSGILAIFNEPLARTLYELGREPSPGIITEIITRSEGFVHSLGFASPEYAINKNSGM